MEPPPTESPIADSIVVSDAAVLSSPSVESGGEDADSTWRDELTARLNHYRARRKAPPPRYPSLKLPFGPAESPVKAGISGAPGFEAVSNKALAREAAPFDAMVTDQLKSAIVTEPERQPEPAGSASRAKIIEFPRFIWDPPVPPSDQLAEPVIDRPRILEVPEVEPPLPALGGITIEPAQKEETQERPGIDFPLQAAPLALRILASLIDGMIVCVAAFLFGFVFWKITAIRPPRLQILSLAAGIPSVFWAAYQYLLIVYSASTPGLRAARLELARFDGSRASRSLRRWRVLASFLSAASLGMGYAWVFLDEDSLCWHDRITQTHLAPRKPANRS